ncbi:MAG TPA: hypothetical protein VHJ76_04215 [Actinomycetota bacterium]|nr:hypothetical protein [Actinomycetota bacterium]
MTVHKRTYMRTSATAALLLLLSGCTRTGINAGEEGGQAFILFTVMLLITIAILWFILGREE